jgi:membrane protease YdiL (CAAX protease family)
VDSRTVLHVVFLLFVLGVMPRAAFRSARILKARAAGGGGSPGAPAAPAAPAVSRERILVSTIFSHAVLGALTWYVAHQDGRDLFACDAIGGRELLAGALVLAVHFALRAVLLALRTEQERRRPPAMAWMPQTARQWGLYVTVCATAGLVEESTYRGVLVWIVAPWLGLVPAALLAAVAFAVAHVAQGRKAVAVIFLMALSQHWLVEFTGTLIVAMVLHTVYDLAAGVLRRRRLRREAAQAARQRA